MTEYSKGSDTVFHPRRDRWEGQCLHQWPYRCAQTW